MHAHPKTGLSTVEGVRLGGSSRRRKWRWHSVVAAGVLATLALGGDALAGVVRFEDNEGRRMTFDVRASGVDTEWYADLLRNATHGDEIGSVTIRIVERDRLARHCGPGASGCYSRTRGGARIVVPAGRNADVAHTLLHEYGHHVDHAHRHGRLQEPNGTPAWWAARKMAIRVKRGKVAFGYQRGWERSIGEIFAEDYAQTQLQTGYGISWLPAPDARIRAALERDLGTLPAAPAQPDVEPLVIKRSGRIAAGERRAMPFGLLGPDRRVTFTVRLGGAQRAGTRARLELECAGVRITKPVRKGVAVARIDRRNLGPGQCRVGVRNVSGTNLAYSVTLRLAVQK